MSSSRRKVGESVPGDEQGAYPRERLLKMDEKFCSRLEHAIRRGKEHTPIRFTDQQIAILRELAAPLAPSQRSEQVFELQFAVLRWHVPYLLVGKLERYGWDVTTSPHIK
jgi:hypothetical protein